MKRTLLTLTMMAGLTGLSAMCINQTQDSAGVDRGWEGVGVQRDTTTTVVVETDTGCRAIQVQDKETGKLLRITYQLGEDGLPVCTRG